MNHDAVASAHFNAYRLTAGGLPATVFAVPSRKGAQLFCRRGLNGLRETVSEWLDRVAGPGALLRVVDELPVAGDSELPRPRHPRTVSVEASGTRVRAIVAVPYDLALFQGHFPDVPIVPGAILIGWASGLAIAAGLWPEGRLHIHAVKFRRIVQPGMRITIEAGVDEDGGRLDFRIESGVATHAAGTILRLSP